MTNEQRKLAKEREKNRCQAQILLDKAENEKRPLTEEEQAEFDQLTASAEEARLEYEAIEAREEAAGKLRQGDGWMQSMQPTLPGRQHPATSSITNPEFGGGSQNGHSPGCVTGDTPRTYANLFGAQLSNDGWGSANEFFASIHNSLNDPRQIMAANMGESLGSTGGFGVPEEFAAKWLDTALEDEIVRPRASVWPMESATLKVPGWVDDDNSSTLYGGFSHEWLGENSTATDSSPTMRQIALSANKLALFTKASNELIADGRGLEEQLQAAMIAATSWTLDYYFLNGNGAGQPKGVLNSDSRVTVAKESGQVADTIVYENLAKMFARVAPNCIKNSVWVCNPTAIPQLLQLVIVSGTGGSHIPVLQESGGKFTILTRPVLFTEKVPAVGTEGDISLIDFSGYAVGLRKEISLEKSMHIGWQSDSTGYRTILRADGQSTWAAAHTPKNGDTLSWCVTLADR